MLDDDFLDVGRLYVLIESSVRIDDYYRPARAKAEAACHNKLNLFVKFVFLKQSFEFVKNLLAVSGGTARTAANKYMSSFQHLILLYSIAVSVFGYRLAVDDMACHDLPRAFSVYMHVSYLFLSGSKYLDDRLVLADTYASGL